MAGGEWYFLIQTETQVWAKVPLLSKNAMPRERASHGVGLFYASPSSEVTPRPSLPSTYAYYLENTSPSPSLATPAADGQPSSLISKLCRIRTEVRSPEVTGSHSQRQTSRRGNPHFFFFFCYNRLKLVVLNYDLNGILLSKLWSSADTGHGTDPVFVVPLPRVWLPFLPSWNLHETASAKQVPLLEGRTVL